MDPDQRGYANVEGSVLNHPFFTMSIEEAVTDDENSELPSQGDDSATQESEPPAVRAEDPDTRLQPSTFQHAPEVNESEAETSIPDPSPLAHVSTILASPSIAGTAAAVMHGTQNAPEDVGQGILPADIFAALTQLTWDYSLGIPVNPYTGLAPTTSEYAVAALVSTPSMLQMASEAHEQQEQAAEAVGDTAGPSSVMVPVDPMLHASAQVVPPSPAQGRKRKELGDAISGSSPGPSTPRAKKGKRGKATPTPSPSPKKGTGQGPSRGQIRH